MQAFLDFHTHALKEPDWGELIGEETWQMRDGYVLWYTRVSHSQILSPHPEDLPRPANEEQIIAQQWERYEARSSPDTYDTISCIVAHAVEHLGQEDAMSPHQLYAALRHVREHIAPILTGGETKGRGGGNSSISMTRTWSRITCSYCLGLVFYFSYFDDIGLYVRILMTLVFVEISYFL